MLESVLILDSLRLVFEPSLEVVCFAHRLSHRLVQLRVFVEEVLHLLLVWWIALQIFKNGLIGVVINLLITLDSCLECLSFKTTRLVLVGVAIELRLGRRVLDNEEWEVELQTRFKIVLCSCVSFHDPLLPFSIDFHRPPELYLGVNEVVNPLYFALHGLVSLHICMFELLDLFEIIALRALVIILVVDVMFSVLLLLRGRLGIRV